MERIIGNPGLDHITDQIFTELDTPSLIQCCCVSKLWCSYASRISLARQLKYLWQRVIRYRMTSDRGFYYETLCLCSQFPQMKALIERLINRGSTDELKVVTFQRIHEDYNLMSTLSRANGRHSLMS